MQKDYLYLESLYEFLFVENPVQQVFKNIYDNVAAVKGIPEKKEQVIQRTETLKKRQQQIEQFINPISAQGNKVNLWR